MHTIIISLLTYIPSALPCCSILMSFDFSIIVQGVVLLKSVGLVFEFAAFLWLRRVEPDTPRPFRVAGGWYGAVGITLPVMALLVFTFVTADWKALLVTGVCNVAFVISYYLRKHFGPEPKQKHVVVKFEKFSDHRGVSSSYQQSDYGSGSSAITVSYQPIPFVLDGAPSPLASPSPHPPSVLA